MWVEFFISFYFLHTVFKSPKYILPHLNSYSRPGFPETTPGTPRGAAGWTSWWLPVWCAGPARWPPGRRLGARCWAPPISKCKTNSSKSATGLVQCRRSRQRHCRWRKWWPWIPAGGRPLQNRPGSESPTRSGPPSLCKGTFSIHQINFHHVPGMVLFITTS